MYLKDLILFLISNKMENSIKIVNKMIKLTQIKKMMIKIKIMLQITLK
jgi:hypothetical protein